MVAELPRCDRPIAHSVRGTMSAASPSAAIASGAITTSAMMGCSGVRTSSTRPPTITRSMRAANATSPRHLSRPRRPAVGTRTKRAFRVARPNSRSGGRGGHRSAIEARRHKRAPFLALAALGDHCRSQQCGRSSSQRSLLGGARRVSVAAPSEATLADAQQRRAERK